MTTAGRQFLGLIANTLFIRLFGLPETILIRRILDVHAIGAWNLTGVVQGYMNSTTLGVTYSGERAIPYALGQGDRQRADRIQGVMLGQSLAEGLVVAGGAALFLLWYGPRVSDPHLRFALNFVPALYLAQKVWSAYLAALRARQAFTRFTKMRTVMMFLDWVVLLYAYLWGFGGVLVGSVANGAFIVGYLYFLGAVRGMPRVRWSFSFAETRVLMRYGTPYSVFKALFTLVERLDVWFVTYLLGTSGVAYYFLGVTLAAFLLEIPLALVYLLYPRLMETLGRVGNLSGLFPQLRTYSDALLFVILPLTVSAGFFGSEFVIRYFLPGFTPGIAAVKILIAIVFLTALRHPFLQVLMAGERVGGLIGVTLGSALGFVPAFILARAITVDVLVAVACAAGVVQLLYLLLAMSAAYRAMGWAPHHLGSVARALGVTAYWFAALFFIDRIWGLTGDHPVADFVRLAGRETAFLAAGLPLALLVLRDALMPLARSIRTGATGEQGG